MTADRRINADRSEGNSASANADSAYRVGYRRPPMGSRFKPGQSGNTKGRPKNSKSLTARVREEMTATITVQEGEKSRKVTKIAGVVLRQIQNALKGNDRAAMAVIQMARQLGLLQELPPETVEQHTFTPAEQEVLDQLLSRPLSTKRR